MTTTGDNLFPIAVLLDEMKSEDVEARINAMKKLRLIAQALGIQRTRTELLPFLSEQVEDDDEVLLVMANELGQMIDLVGGPKEAVILLNPLCSLAGVEETVVRDKAVESLNTVIHGLDGNDTVEHVVPIIQRLSTGDWFTSRVSACGLFMATYSKLGAQNADTKKILRQLYSTLCTDETPMVRRAASKHIGPLATVVEKEFVLHEIFTLFNGLAGDDQDSVRLLAIENCTAFAKILNQAENNIHILPLIKACASDKSWRVRNNVAKEFYPLSQAMGASVTRIELLPLFVRLLQDPEAEVRASAAHNVAGYVELVGSERFMSDILPVIRESVVDPAQNVRLSLAESLIDITATLTHEQALPTVIPLVMQALRDEAPEVRLKILEGLHKVTNTLGSQFLESTVLPVLLILGNDSLWRVREKVIVQIPLLASSLGAAIFEKDLLTLYLGTYADQVNAVRMAATRCLEPLARSLGTQWMRTKLIPKLQALFNTQGSSYLQRITVLYGVRDLSTHADLSETAEDLLPLLLTAVKDSVPNVRFVAVKILHEGITSNAYSKSRVSTEIQPILSNLASQDTDPDVKYFSQLALEIVVVA